MWNANLSGATLWGTTLIDANLNSVILKRADLSGADLSGANFWGAYLRDANLSDAILSDTDFTGATMPDGREYDPEPHTPGMFML